MPKTISVRSAASPWWFPCRKLKLKPAEREERLQTGLLPILSTLGKRVLGHGFGGNAVNVPPYAVHRTLFLVSACYCFYSNRNRTHPLLGASACAEEVGLFVIASANEEEIGILLRT